MVEPTTRQSLMLRLRNSQDQHSWHEFLSIYEPLLLRLMRQRGLQDADARDVTQQVILAVSQAVDRWEPDGKEASFRRWLFTIARKLSLRFVQRGRAAHHAAAQGTGGTDMVRLLSNLPEPDKSTSSEFETEYRTQIIHWAAEKVRDEFRDSTWQAFWRTCVLHEPIPATAELLGVTVGSIYISRSRVIGRIRQIVEEIEVSGENL